MRCRWRLRKERGRGAELGPAGHQASLGRGLSLLSSGWGVGVGAYSFCPRTKKKGSRLTETCVRLRLRRQGRSSCLNRLRSFCFCLRVGRRAHGPTAGSRCWWPGGGRARESRLHRDAHAVGARDALLASVRTGRRAVCARHGLALTLVWCLSSRLPGSFLECSWAERRGSPKRPGTRRSVRLPR